MEQTVQSVDRALSLLLRVAEQEGASGVGVRDLARATGLKVSTAQNLLKTLLSRGFLDFDTASRKYRLGLTAVLLGERAYPLDHLAAFARPWIDALADELRETVAVAAWFRGQAVVVDWRQAEQPLAVTHARRVIAKPHAMAAGRTLLAYLGEEERLAQARRLTGSSTSPNLPAAAEEFLAVLDTVRRDSLAETRDIGGSGIGAVSAPVLDASDRLIMAVSSSAPLDRWDTGTRESAKAAVTRSAHQMTAALGGPAADVSGNPAPARPLHSDYSKDLEHARLSSR